MNLKITPNRYPYLIVIAFIIYSLILLIKFIFYKGFIPDWDEANHLLMGFYYYDAFKNAAFAGTRNLFFNSNSLYPPFYHFLIAIMFNFAKTWDLAAIFSNIPFILILMLSIYGLGVNFIHRKAGLYAALLTPLLPLFLTLQEKSVIDYASISMFVCSFYFLFKTEQFSNRIYSALFGFTILLGLLIKWPFVIPGIPFVFYALDSVYRKWPKPGNEIVNILIALGISLPALLWYISNYSFMVANLDFFWNPNGFPQILWANPSGFTLKNFLLYSFYSPIEPAGVGLFVLIFFYVSIFSARHSIKEWYLLGSVFVTYLVLTYLDDKSSLYIGYTYPLLMLVTAITLQETKKRVFGVYLFLVFIGVILVNFGLSLHNFTSYNQLYINIGNSKFLLFPNYDTKYKYTEWPTKKIIEDIVNPSECSKNILVFTDSRFINPSNINFYLNSKKVGIFAEPAYLHYNPVTSTDFNLQYLDTYDCIITKTGDAGTFANKKVIERVDIYLKSNIKYKYKEYSAPDNSTIYVYILKK